MEVKKLTIQEIPQAIMVAKGVFNYQIRQNLADESLARSFDEYTGEYAMTRMVEENRLHLWGIYADGQLCAMSAMQTEGHITMLYVLPFYRRRGMGMALVREMKQYAAGTLGLRHITANAMPAWSASFFARCGFCQMDPRQNGMSPYVSMDAKIKPEVVYPVRPVPDKLLVGLTSGFLVFAVAAVVIFFAICG